MEREKLITYLKEVLELEKQSYVAERAWKKNKERLDSMGGYMEPCKPVFNPPKQPTTNAMSVVILAGFGLIIVLLLYWLADVMVESSSFLFGLIGTLGKVVGPFAIVAVIGFGIHGFFSESAEDSRKQKAYEREYTLAKNAYDERMREYDKTVKLRKAQQSRELAVIPGYKKSVQLLQERKEKSKNILNQYYNLNVIKPKYRSLACVATFVEYLENERCYALEGHEGCYNLFEQEQRMGMIIAQLFDISQQLKQVRSNQEELKDAMTWIACETERLTLSVEKNNAHLSNIEQEQRIQSYYAEQNAQDTRFLRNYVEWHEFFGY